MATVVGADDWTGADDWAGRDSVPVGRRVTAKAITPMSKTTVKSTPPLGPVRLLGGGFAVSKSEALLGSMQQRGSLGVL